MSLMETAQLLGNFGEFFGAIAVVATLGYLAAQIRQNTRSMDESRRLAIAQGYQARAETIIQAMRQKADSQYIAETLAKAKGRIDGSLDALEEERLYAWVAAYAAELDNLHFQYQQGFVDDEFYNAEFRTSVRQYAPDWKSLGMLNRFRAEFRREVERILEDG